MNCKTIKKEIARNSQHISDATSEHIKTCKSCREEYELARKIDMLILAAPELNPPPNLKYSIIEKASTARGKNWLFDNPLISFSVRTFATAVLLIFGFWLGLQTTNGTVTEYQPALELAEKSSEIIETAAVLPDGLGEIYFETVLEDQIEQ